MTIFFGNFLLWEFTVSKGAKVFIFSIWLLFWHYLVLNTWNHLYNGRRSRVCAGGLWNRSSPSPPGVLPNFWADIHFHFPCTVQAYAKGWETASPASFYNRVQQYKNLILSPFMLPIKLQMLLLSGVSFMHVIEWVICQPPALWYYWAKCCLFPMLKHFSMSFQLLLCMNFSRARASIDSKQRRIINISS